MYQYLIHYTEIHSQSTYCILHMTINKLLSNRKYYLSATWPKECCTTIIRFCPFYYIYFQIWSMVTGFKAYSYLSVKPTHKLFQWTYISENNDINRECNKYFYKCLSLVSALVDRRLERRQFCLWGIYILTSEKRNTQKIFLDPGCWLWVCSFVKT